jgi:hypothetical protein
MFEGKASENQSLFIADPFFDPHSNNTIYVEGTVISYKWPSKNCASRSVQGATRYG